MSKEDVLTEVPKDISKRTIAILIIVAIILSVTSTLMAVARTPQVKSFTEDTGSAQIKVTVAPPPDTQEAQIKVNVAEGE